MDIPQETENYIRESIQDSLGLPVSEKTLRLKLLASQEERHLLQDQNFILQDQLKELHKRFQSSKEEASMNAQALRKCIQERETLVAKYAEMQKYCAKLERECMLFERDLEKAMESCDELEKENNELRAQLQDNSALQAMSAEVKSLQEDKENLLINLQRAEEEVKVLFEDNKLLDELNKRLLRQLQRGKERHGSDYKRSASGSSARGKRKSRRFREGSPFAREADSNLEEQSRQPFSPLYQNSPESRLLNK
ncbi:hypothetical protein IEQ34_010020 [Dendrobium chrysotoxum]|uniref:Uncharacterized protein n=1 Tax=Dendrobium chrysotoxum TaxID=161865 RepID=A0AAV7H2I5_DENCH|nr:hypothetical protein IEQ34_010020 [Dendrobium chrysotoxum]